MSLWRYCKRFFESFRQEVVTVEVGTFIFIFGDWVRTFVNFCKWKHIFSRVFLQRFVPFLFPFCFPFFFPFFVPLFFPFSSTSSTSSRVRFHFSSLFLSCEKKLYLKFISMIFNVCVSLLYSRFPLSFVFCVLSLPFYFCPFLFFFL